MLRNYLSSDEEELNRVALASFSQFREHYDDWTAMAANVSRMSDLAATSEIVVAEDCGRIVGGVAYVPAGVAKAPYFQPDWPIIRMLVVHPASRGKGIGRALTEECISRARRDRAPAISLHTTPIMNVALSMYLRMGFKPVREAPSIYGVSYAVYDFPLA